MRGTRKSIARTLALDIDIARKELHLAIEELARCTDGISSAMRCDVRRTALGHVELAARALRGVGR